MTLSEQFSHSEQRHMSSAVWLKDDTGASHNWNIEEKVVFLHDLIAKVKLGSVLDLM